MDAETYTHIHMPYMCRTYAIHMHTYTYMHTDKGGAGGGGMSGGGGGGSGDMSGDDDYQGSGKKDDRKDGGNSEGQGQGKDNKNRKDYSKKQHKKHGKDKDKDKDKDKSDKAIEMAGVTNYAMIGANSSVSSMSGFRGGVASGGGSGGVGVGVGVSPNSKSVGQTSVIETRKLRADTMSSEALLMSASLGNLKALEMAEKYYARKMYEKQKKENAIRRGVNSLQAQIDALPKKTHSADIMRTKRKELKKIIKQQWIESSKFKKKQKCELFFFGGF